jgi:hypothetical protein
MGTPQVKDKPAKVDLIDFAGIKKYDFSKSVEDNFKALPVKPKTYQEECKKTNPYARQNLSRGRRAMKGIGLVYAWDLAHEVYINKRCEKADK